MPNTRDIFKICLLIFNLFVLINAIINIYILCGKFEAAYYNGDVSTSISRITSTLRFNIGSSFFIDLIMLFIGCKLLYQLCRESSADNDNINNNTNNIHTDTNTKSNTYDSNPVVTYNPTTQPQPLPQTQSDANVNPYISTTDYKYQSYSQNPFTA